MTENNEEQPQEQFDDERRPLPTPRLSKAVEARTVAQQFDALVAALRKEKPDAAD